MSRRMTRYAAGGGATLAAVFLTAVSPAFAQTTECPSEKLLNHMSRM